MRGLLLVVIIAGVAGCASLARAAIADPFTRPQHFSPQDLSAFTDARIAALKAGLQLKPEQEKNWPALEAALREVAKAQIAREEEWRDRAPVIFDTDPVGALQRRAHYLLSRASELEKLSAAAKPLADTLDEAQKRRFGPLLRTAIARRGRAMRSMGRMGASDAATFD